MILLCTAMTRIQVQEEGDFNEADTVLSTPSAIDGCVLHFATPDEERECVRNAQAGDERSFERLVCAYQLKAYTSALRLVRNPDDALELTQDAFLKAFKALHSFDIRQPFFPWFARIVRNHCLNYLKRRAKQQEESLEAMEEEFVQFRSPDADPHTRLRESEDRDRLWKAIDRLKPDFREIIVMRHFHELSYEELASALHVPIGTVMSRLFNGRRELARLMRENTVEAAA